MAEDYEAKYQRRQALKKLQTNMALFGKVCFPTALRKDTPPFHKEIYRNLMDPSVRRVLTAAPRGTAKSTVTSLILPLWRAAFKRSDEDLFMVIISESQAQSINFLSRIKYHLTHSHKFKALFGDMGPRTAKRWTNTDVVLANGTRIVAVGTGQRVRGFIEGDTRPNLIIIDDFESELNAATSEARVKNRKWITEAVIPSLSDDGRIALIGTVISEDCFLYWAKDSPAWKVLWFSIVDEEGNSIWKDRFPLSRVDEIKKEFASVGNLTGFYQEYMNIAQAPEDAPFRPDWMKLHHYDFTRKKHGHPALERLVGEETKVIPVETYMGIDPASSLNANADYFCIAVIAKDHDDNAYLIDVIRQRISPAMQPDKIIEFYLKYKPKRTTIESVAYQEALRDTVRKKALEMNLIIPGLERKVKPRTRKSERLMSLAPVLAKGKFYFRPQDTLAQQEFMSFPKGKHDDIMDAIWYAMDCAKPCRIKEIDKNPEKKKKRKFIDWMVM
jgi:predicted phage terminase large subunit-like protein